MSSPESASSHMVTLLSAVSVTGTGPARDLGDLRDEIVLQAETTGSPAFSVQFLGSLDGSNWFALGSPVTSVTAGTSVTGVLARYVQADLTALSGGTLTAVVAFSAGD